ncbi:hypothetical protein CHH34_16600 [Aeromonas veronii]|uniref:Uncharacterized protein n=1 Tax=Aeromonas veronii TaxID=654 RepID=A0ABY3MQD8_AERVE|nr:hypothetical protein CHF44_09235 [Aeromonas veronii]RDU88325.1 hypothetical protein CGZ72_05020 [Aeromonas veronii]RDU88574.1 hypothetical protein CGZ76_06350 [Aeromonas veronii]RDU91323.1 hypothetical protein CHH34_16600 [Aeromonas veronii]TEY54972.1 hypothetical protein CIG14_03720 [Aeromonas veronii]
MKICVDYNKAFSVIILVGLLILMDVQLSLISIIMKSVILQCSVDLLCFNKQLPTIEAVKRQIGLSTIFLTEASEQVTRSSKCILIGY